MISKASLASSKRLTEASTMSASASTPRRLETFPSCRSSWVVRITLRPRCARLWRICNAWVLFPDPIVPKKNRSSAILRNYTFVICSQMVWERGDILDFGMVCA